MEKQLTADKNTTGTGTLGLTSNHLKLIAILAMAADHIAVTFLTAGMPLYILLRFLGRFTAPIMFYQAVEGYHYTRNRSRYIGRMAIFAAISYVPFIFFYTGRLPDGSNFYLMNVMYTIMLGLLAIKARNEISNPLLKTAAIMVLVILSLLGDQAYVCILIMLTMDYYRGSFKNQIFAYLLIILGISGLMTVFTTPFITLFYEQRLDFTPLWQGLHMFGLFVPIFILSLYNGKKGNGGNLAKWGFYVFYPLHMLILGLIKMVM